MPVSLQMDGSIKAQANANSGLFSNSYLFEGSDVGLNRNLNLASISTLQYDLAASSIQVRTIWEIVQTALSLKLGRSPPYYHESVIDWLARLTIAETGEGVPNMPVSIIAQDSSGAIETHEGTTDGFGNFTFTKLLALLTSYELQAQFPATTIDYKELSAAASEKLSFSVTDVLKSVLTLRVLKNYSPLTFGDPDLVVKFTVKDVSGNTIATVEEQNGVVELDPLSYPVTYTVECIATYKSIDYSFSPKTVNFTTEGSSEIVELNIIPATDYSDESAEGRLNLTLLAPTSANVNQTVTLTGSVNFLVKALQNRAVRVPFAKITIFVNDVETLQTRTNAKGNFSVDYTPAAVGSYVLYTAVVRPIRGAVARSASETLTVVES
jgi:hypothetical protein